MRENIFLESQVQLFKVCLFYLDEIAPRRKASGTSTVGRYVHGISGRSGFVWSAVLGTPSVAPWLFVNIIYRIRAQSLTSLESF